MPDKLIDGYAEAILAVASAEAVLEAVEDELFRFARALESGHELRNALSDIALPYERKKAVVDQLLGDKASPATVAFVNYVVAQGRARELPAIADAFVARAAALRQREVAEVRSAVELDAATQDRLARALGKATGKQVTLKVVIDPGVLGGIVATVGDVVIDGSVRHKLDTLREQLV